MTKDLDDTYLDAFFEAGQKDAPKMDADFMARIMADAAAVSAAQHAPKPAASKAKGLDFSWLLRAVPSIGGLAACAMIGGYFGYTTSSDVFLGAEGFALVDLIDASDDLGSLLSIE